MKINIPTLEEQRRIVEDANTPASIHIQCTKQEKKAFLEHCKKTKSKLTNWALQALKDQMLDEISKEK